MMMKVSNSPKRLKIKRKVIKLEEKPLNKELNRMVTFFIMQGAKVINIKIIVAQKESRKRVQ